MTDKTKMKRTKSKQTKQNEKHIKVYLTDVETQQPTNQPTNRPTNPTKRILSVSKGEICEKKRRQKQE
jgi:hypothetical protein